MTRGNQRDSEVHENVNLEKFKGTRAVGAKFRRTHADSSGTYGEYGDNHHIVVRSVSA